MNMRELTDEERRVLDQIPQETFLRYAGTRFNEQRASRINRQCGHRKTNPECRICRRAESIADRHVKTLVQPFGKQPDEMRKLLEDVASSLDGAKTDLAGALTLILGTDRRITSQLIRAFNMEL